MRKTCAKSRVCLLVAFLFVAWSPNLYGQKILGKYLKQSNASEYIELEKGGTFIARESGVTVSGKWNRVDNEVRLFVTVYGTDRVERLRISEDQLIEENGTIWIKQEEYARMQERDQESWAKARLETVKQSLAELDSVILNIFLLEQSLANALKPYLTNDSDLIIRLSNQVDRYKSADTAKIKNELYWQITEDAGRLMDKLWSNPILKNTKEIRDMIVQIELAANQQPAKVIAYHEARKTLENSIDAFPENKSMKSIAAEYEKYKFLEPPK
jgi:hypothetical protein